MPVSAHDVRLLLALAHFYVLTREQLQRLCFPEHASGRSTRKHLVKLQRGGYVTKHRIPVLLPGTNGAAPVYYLTKAGAELLASWFDDETYRAANTRTPRGDRLSHWIALNETRMVIEAAVARQNDVELRGWINEWETVNKDDHPEAQFTLHTQLAENPPLSCSPDAAFLLATRGHAKVYYLERDLGTSSPKQVASRKTRGYAELARREGHRRHFPETTAPAFSVLCITTGVRRCQAIGAELKKREMPHLWLLVDQRELRPETFLFEPITYNHLGEAGPLVKRPAAPQGAQA